MLDGAKLQITHLRKIILSKLTAVSCNVGDESLDLILNKG